VGNLVAEAGQGDRHLVFLGHMDTVPGEIPVEIRDGRMYGRGSVDAKGPLVSAVVALMRAAQTSHMRLTVIGAVQEEGPSVGARHLVDRPAPDYLVIGEPSNWDALVLGYKGSQRFTVTLRRPSSHTAGPEASSPMLLVDFWNRLSAWCDSRSGEAKGEFDRLAPTLIRMNSHDDGLADVACMLVGLRLPLGITIEEVRRHVRSLLPEAEFEFVAGEEAVRGNRANPLVSAFARAVRAEGGDPRFKVKTGTSDMNVVGPVWGCPMLAYGPGDSRLDHTPAEHVVVEDFLRAVRVLTRVFEELP
jgi:LysW-gamma-L-lysine carboxypeptidase